VRHGKVYCVGIDDGSIEVTIGSIHGGVAYRVT